MSRREHIKTDGTAKIGFQTIEQAESFIERLKYKNPRGIAMNVYECPYCHELHIGRDRTANTFPELWDEEATEE